MNGSQTRIGVPSGCTGGTDCATVGQAFQPDVRLESLTYSIHSSAVPVRNWLRITSRGVVFRSGKDRPFAERKATFISDERLGTRTPCCRVAIGCATLLLVMVGSGVKAGDAVAGRAEKTSFNRDIRPILSDKCFKCHGPDAKQRKAKLRLDNVATPWRRPPRAARRSCRASSTRASSISGSPPTTPRSACRRREAARSLSPAEIARLKTLDRAGRRVPGALGVRPAGPARACPRSRTRLVPQPDRRLHPGPARERRARAVARGRPGHADPPAQPRPDRPAADDRGGRRASWPIRGRDAYAQAGRPAARLAALRRALGADLARRRPLCRFRRLREGQVAPGLLLSRLGHQRPRTATCPTTSSSSSRSPATCSRTRRRTRSSPRASSATR